MAIGVQTDMATPALARFGSDALRARIPGAVDRRRLRRLPRRLRSRRRLRRRLDQDHARGEDGGDYVINGGKMWTTNGTQADWMCLLANTGEGPVHKNKSLICLPMKTKGVQVAQKLDKLGMRSSDTAQIFFDEVRVPQRYLIGEEGKGFIYQMQQFQEERLWARGRRLSRHGAAASTQTIEYTRERKVFGRPLLDKQVGAVPAGRAQDRGRAAARAGLSRLRAVSSPART